jgi:site-specific DNA-methyltransferase (adenine-specific)
LRSNIWYYSPSEKLDSKGNKHPAIFPWRLVQDHILTWSNPGDTVFDPMTGSGTVPIVAKKNNRNYIGIDIVNSYCELAKERLGEING